MSVQPVLIDGQWIASVAQQTFHAVDPAIRRPLADEYPISPWEEIERAIVAAARAFETVRDWPGERFAAFLDAYAGRIEGRADSIVETAHRETALAKSPRLAGAELPRTIDQLRQAATAAREGSWAAATIDTRNNIRSMFAPIGPVAVFGPNNFPLAFGSISGGDFAAAVAAGNPVLAKGHSSHPGTTRLFAQAALEAASETEMPPGFVQLIFRTSHADGCRLVSHPLMGATGYTGSRAAGLKLKSAADEAGKPISLELSSINPVFILPGALEERSSDVAEQFASSCLMGAGQFCTNPGLVVLLAGEKTDAFIDTVTQRFRTAPPDTMLGEGVFKGFGASLHTLTAAGAELVTGGMFGEGWCYENTLLRVSGDVFLENAEALQSEVFGNESLFVVARDAEQMVRIAERLEGNLTGTIYSDTRGGDDGLHDRVAPALRQLVGRLINDKMPTGVAVSPAMNHGGPYPATGHAGFTAVGIPASLRRFAVLHCYDNVRPRRLPPALQNQNPTGQTWRLIDGEWTRGDVG